MNWSNWQAFWAMGGYGLYVWGSLGVSLLALVVEWGLTWQGRAHARRALRGEP
ncbi:heme exporter protein CcmD [Aquabacterium sp.]|uniref:heme exporter protein CcmD n=1 Tax=Aquabacterium sp. TaxID=1872578 RepID=UPI0035B3047D